MPDKSCICKRDEVCVCNEKLCAKYIETIKLNSIEEFSNLFCKFPLILSKNDIPVYSPGLMNLDPRIIPFEYPNISLELHREVFLRLGCCPEHLFYMIEITGSKRIGSDGIHYKNFDRDLEHLQMIVELIDHSTIKNFVCYGDTILSKVSRISNNPMNDCEKIQKFLIYLIKNVGINPMFEPSYEGIMFPSIMYYANTMNLTYVVKILFEDFNMNPSEKSKDNTDPIDIMVTNAIYLLENVNFSQVQYSDYFQRITDHLTYLTNINYEFTPTAKDNIKSLDEILGTYNKYQFNRIISDGATLETTIDTTIQSFTTSKATIMSNDTIDTTDAFENISDDGDNISPEVVQEKYFLGRLLDLVWKF